MEDYLERTPLPSHDHYGPLIVKQRKGKEYFPPPLLHQDGERSRKSTRKFMRKRHISTPHVHEMASLPHSFYAVSLLLLTLHYHFLSFIYSPSLLPFLRVTVKGEQH
jgi:hypothetical protein